MNRITILIIVFFVMGMSISYMIGRREIGPKTAIKNISFAIVIIGILSVFGLVLFHLFPNLWNASLKAYTNFLLVVFGWTYIIILVERKRQAGFILLSFDRSMMQKINIIFGSIIAAGAIISLMGMLIENGGATESKWISQNLLSFSLGAFLLAVGLSANGIGKNGILYFDRFVKWSRIESYEWEGVRHLTLRLRIDSRVSFLRTLRIPVPADLKEPVTIILTQNIKVNSSSE